MLDVKVDELLGKKQRSAPLPTDENRVSLRCNQALVISGVICVNSVYR